jgi:hypothetical protein
MKETIVGTILVAAAAAGCVIPPPSPAPPAPGPQIGPAPPQQADVDLAGRWWSEPHVSYTNAAMVSADIYFEITLDSSGDIGGLWGRYICVASAYGIMSCGKGPFDGLVHGKLDATHDGWIDLERLGRSNLAWAVVATSPDKLTIELPNNWQGEENVLFRSTVTRQ